MKTALFIILSGVTVAAVSVGIAARQQQGAPGRISGWRGDLERLVEEARRVHAGPARPAHTPEFAQAAADLSRLIPNLPDHRIVVEFQRILATLGDGHSLVYPVPSPHASFAMIPLDLYFFDDGLFIVDAGGTAHELIGSRIVKFGSQTTEAIVRRMEPFVSRDNAVGLQAFVPLYAIMPAFLEACGATDDPARVTLTVIDRQQRTRELTVTAGTARRVRKRLFAPAAGPEPPPLYLQHADREYFVRPLPEHGAVYFQFNQVADAADVPLAAFAAQLRDTLAAANADYLIVDVRHNNGGNNTLLDPLIQTIAGFAAGSSRRRVYVLTSRSTFSAAQNFITRLERRVPRAVFAGEPSMSSPNFTGEDNAVTLPFSGLTVSISNRYWQDSDAADRRRWIAPHIPMALTSQDWLNNRDPVMGAVFRAIATSRRVGGR